MTGCVCVRVCSVQVNVYQGDLLDTESSVLYTGALSRCIDHAPPRQRFHLTVVWGQEYVGGALLMEFIRLEQFATLLLSSCGVRYSSEPLSTW